MPRFPVAASHLPPAALLPRYVARALALWIGVRACYAMTLLASGAIGPALDSVRAPGVQSVLFVVLTGAVALVDLSRARGRVFLGNLGVSPRAMVTLSLAAAAAGEVLRGAVVAVL